jgi:hypothetical protein
MHSPTHSYLRNSTNPEPPERHTPNPTTSISQAPASGSVGDSCDNALAESVNSLYQAELIYGPNQGPWRSVEEADLVYLGLGPLVKQGTHPRVPQQHPQPNTATPNMSRGATNNELETNRNSLQQTQYAPAHMVGVGGVRDVAFLCRM